MISINARHKTHAGVRIAGLPDDPVAGRPVVVLAGGTGGAKLARGTARRGRATTSWSSPTPRDDVEVHGAHVSPDPDLVTFWLADRIDDARLGAARRQFAVMDALRELGEDVWFNLGDRDLAIGLRRAAAAGRGRAADRGRWPSWPSARRARRACCP